MWQTVKFTKGNQTGPKIETKEVGSFPICQEKTLQICVGDWLFLNAPFNQEPNKDLNKL